MDNSLKKRTFKNLIYSFSAQIISICLSISMSLIIPKILGVEDFGYWQLFLFYINYVGFFHFGITDGMYLKNGGIEYNKLDKKNISSQFYMLFLLQMVLLLLFSVLSYLFINDGLRKLIIIFTGIYMIVANMNWYLGYVFQATNRVKLYSVSVMIDKLIFLLFIVIAALFKLKNLIIYISFFIFTTLCALIFSVYNSKEILLTKPYTLKESYKIAFDSARVGIKLTLSSVSSLLILGVGRFLVDKVWGIEAFGKFSFALSLTNFFLLFISQISIVLFPTLRQVNIDVAKKLYYKFNVYLDLLLPVIYVLYIPMKMILEIWLPQYSISLIYLSMLLPICIFDGKTQMINNTYFKVLRKENTLLKINLITVFISSVFSIASVFIIKNINFVIIGMLFSICVRSIIGEIYLSRYMNVATDLKNLILIIIFSILFIFYNFVFSNIISFVFTFISYLAYIYFSKSYIFLFEMISTSKK
jgi:hypothetical protein